MAGLHELRGVGAHERDGHADLRPIWKDQVSVIPEFLDEAEDVIPAAGVQPGGVVAQLVEDFLHLEGGENRLDQHGRADAAAWNA